jgi:hypothetical protein
MRDQPTSAVPHQARTHKRCPSCGDSKSLSDFYTTPSGTPSGYCKACQRAISRRARKRRNAAIRALIALHPDAWCAALARSDNDEADCGDRQGGGSDVA